MALSMHTNYASLVTQNNLNSTNNLLNTAMERLSTGLRINSAADDAAGLQISSRLEAQTRGMSVAMRNAQDGISMLQTAEGALDEATNIMYRMNDLALQASNGTNTQEDRDALNAEYGQLNDQLAEIMTDSNFGGQKLLDPAQDGSLGKAAVTLQVGEGSTDTLAIDVTTELGDLNTAIGAVGDNKLGDISSAAGATAAITALSEADGTLELIGTARSSMGASINRLEHTITNLSNMVENTTASKGRITDADFAVESANMTKNQMLMQAGTTILSQTNQLPGMAMSLLR
ncbi:lateral flagellin LafA [Vibrio sp. 10N]|uniref:lateral flagellin LafA n=1 Tax=Vibrio sp. 10N TaxID=3058938 RepID=UPI00281380CB|nr:lateral flagellin LafA [Vibrio sp. 10N]